ncbi:MAG: cysteine desulfurase [Chitinophagaceae bacterium]|nr:cysteine desulfurase [Chitinophagaceae bacterium]
MKVYLDNAATTKLDEEVFKEMTPYLLENYGNPSSAHQQGRNARLAIENARNRIAALLNASPSEIYFTSGGTEADNTAIFSSIRGLGITHAITSKFEHHAILNPLKQLQQQGNIKLSYVANDKDGNLDLADLKDLLSRHPRSFVSVMHGNNEIGNLNDIQAISELCEQYDAVFHSDTVQTMGHYHYDLKKLKAQFIVGSAHKFHGPKGTGFIYSSNRIKLPPLILGGAQEHSFRAGTENVAGIVGLARALEIALKGLQADQAHVTRLKKRLIEQLRASVPGVIFNGNSGKLDKSLYTVLSASFPNAEKSDLLLPYLDSRNIAVSGGSACNSHSEGVSHVLKALQADPYRSVVRFSFSKFNVREEIDYVASVLNEIYHPEANILYDCCTEVQ